MPYPHTIDFSWDVADAGSIFTSFKKEICNKRSVKWSPAYTFFSYKVKEYGKVYISLPMTSFARCLRLRILNVEPPISQIELRRIIVIQYNVNFQNPKYELSTWVKNQTKISQSCEKLSKPNKGSELVNASRANQDTIPESVQKLEAENYTCQDRQRSARYDMRSGYIGCQCDVFCDAFDDCCPDYWPTNKHGKQIANNWTVKKE